MHWKVRDGVDSGPPGILFQVASPKFNLLSNWSALLAHLAWDFGGVTLSLKPSSNRSCYQSFFLKTIRILPNQNPDRFLCPTNWVRFQSRFFISVSASGQLQNKFQWIAKLFNKLSTRFWCAVILISWSLTSKAASFWMSVISHYQILEIVQTTLNVLTPHYPLINLQNARFLNMGKNVMFPSKVPFRWRCCACRHKMAIISVHCLFKVLLNMLQRSINFCHSQWLR